MANKHWDIFCQIIDNFGDIGVAWRLARQLATAHAIPVRLWVDDLTVLHRIWPPTRVDTRSQTCEGVEIHVWEQAFPDVSPGTVVIEAFGCRLPQNYIAAMTQQPVPPVWINLEYLSAEAWVCMHHGLASPHPNLPLVKYFYFPGYQYEAGGLLREPDLLARRETFLNEAQSAFWRRIGVAHHPESLFISMFAYKNAGLPALLDAWLTQPRPIVCLVPEGKIVPQLAAWLSEAALSTGSIHRRAHLTFHILPFMDQDEYDRLLWACDINFVRGEDSCVRAQWAGKPMVWQAYPQAEHAHWAKLEALCVLYAGKLPEDEAHAICNLWRAWNGIGDIASAWAQFIAIKPALDVHARQWARQLSRSDDLASKLLAFVEAHQAG